MEGVRPSPRRVAAGTLALAIAVAPAIASAAGAQDLDVAEKRFVVTATMGHSPATACYDGAVAAASTLRFGLSQDALESCNTALAGDLREADRTATYVNRAIVLSALGRLDDAAADLTRAIERAPELQAAHLTLGGVYSRMGRWRDAEAAFTAGIELNPDATVARDYFTRGGAREELGDIAGARADYETAVALAPDWDLPRRELARFEVIMEEQANGGGA